MATHLIGVLGRKRSGKDTFASRLVADHGYTRFAFADALREAALALDPVIPTEWDECGPLGLVKPTPLRLAGIVNHLGWERAKEIREVRRTLQNMGVGVRNLDPDFWLRVVMDAIGKHPGPAVITDVRFRNELDAVHRAGGWSVRITRPGLPTDDLHVSETELDHTYTNVAYGNSGTVQSLYDCADRTARVVRFAAS